MGTENAIAQSINSVANQSDSQGSSSRIMQAIQTAAYKTGVDFSYLMKKASQESNFDPSAKSTGSSATGLFQFTSQTWLHMVKTYGDQYGLGNYASQIKADATGHLTVSDPVARQAILALRNDPQTSAEMAGELDKENSIALKNNVGGKIGNTELYLAHFLGASGASDFISEMRDNPKAAGADVLPSAAAANPSVFYTKSGEPRSLQQIYQHFAHKFDNSATQVASASASSSAKVSVSGVASVSPISVNLASLFSASSGASSVANAVSGLRSPSKNGMTLASAGNSTLFNAMVLGQAQGTGVGGAPSPFASVGRESDSRKKNAYSVLSSVV